MKDRIVLAKGSIAHVSKQSEKEALKNMSSGGKFTWTFRARFSRHAFGWRSQPAITRIKEAVAEIKKAARKDPLLGGEGAVLLLERISPAIEQVDSSSGAIGTAVNNAIEALVPIIANAPADKKLRDDWLKRLWQAVEADSNPLHRNTCRPLGGIVRICPVRIALGGRIH